LGVQRSGVVEVGDQEGKDAAGDVAHEAAADLFGAFAVAGFLVDVGAGRGVVDHAVGGDQPQRAVGLTVAAAVEALADGFAA
jgi:hypothetical protein